MMKLLRIVAAFLLASMPIFAHGEYLAYGMMFLIGTFVALISAIIFIPYLALRKKHTQPLPKRSFSNAQITAAWAQAAHDLGFEFEPRFKFQLDGLEFTFLGHIKHFGSPQGAFLGPIMEQDIDLPSLLERLEAFKLRYSDVSASYVMYEIEFFKKKLNELGYFGPIEKKPAWCIEKPKHKRMHTKQTP